MAREMRSVVFGSLDKCQSLAGSMQQTLPSRSRETRIDSVSLRAWLAVAGVRVRRGPCEKEWSTAKDTTKQPMCSSSIYLYSHWNVRMLHTTARSPGLQTNGASGELNPQVSNVSCSLFYGPIQFCIQRGGWCTHPMYTKFQDVVY